MARVRRHFTTATLNQEFVWQINRSIRTTRFFEITSKRRKGFPSETRVQRGVRVVHGDKELREKLGRNDPCPCGSGRRFKKCCLCSGRFDGSPRNYFFQGQLKLACRCPPGPNRSLAVQRGCFAFAAASIQINDKSRK